jgi:hypothetical protein
VSEFGWRDLAALLAAATVIGGMVIGWVRYQLRNDFARASDISGLSERIERVELQMRAVPTHEDVRGLAERIARVESAVAVVGANIEGIRDGMGRIERDLHLLVSHELSGKA